MSYNPYKQGRRGAARPHGWITLGSLSDQEKAERLAEWVIRHNRYGDWRACHEDGRKTPLKVSFTAAQEDAINNRCVCPAWPNCRHSSIDICCQQAQIARFAAETERMP